MCLRFFSRSSHPNPPDRRSFPSFLLWLTAVLTLFLVVSEAVFAQGAIRILSHQFDPDHITIGTPIQLRLQIEANESLHIFLDSIEVSEQEHIEADEPQAKQIESKDMPIGKVRYEAIYPLRAFTIGTHALPPITIKYTGADGDTGSIETPAYLFEVRSVKSPGTTELKGIKGPWSAPPNWFLYILVVFLLIVIVGAVALLYLRKRAKPIDLQSAVVSQRQPHEIAYEQLGRIEGMNWITQGKMKVYHTEISHVMRQYIAARYHIPALELTTAELLDRLQTEDTPREQVQRFFTNCDLVKFARYSPTKPETHERMEEARRIVDETKQSWVSEGEEQKNKIREDM